MKKHLILALIVLAGTAVLAAAPHALADTTQFVPLAPITGLTDQTTANSVISSQSFSVFFNNLYKYLLGLAAAAAVIMIIWQGVLIATNRDNASKITDGKGKIVQALYGLLLVLSPYLVFSIINPSILNLSIHMQPIQAPIPQDSTQSTSTPQYNTKGCTPTGTLFLTAVCVTDADAQAFASGCPSGDGRSSGINATCGTRTSQYYAFKNTSSIPGYVSYVAFPSTATDPNNGAEVNQFYTQCHSDGGEYCLGNTSYMRSVACSVFDSTVSGTCWSMQLTCTSPSVFNSVFSACTR
jgi:hypothetical protein